MFNSKSNFLSDLFVTFLNCVVIFLKLYCDFFLKVCLTLSVVSLLLKMKPFKISCSEKVVYNHHLVYCLKLEQHTMHCYEFEFG